VSLAELFEDFIVDSASIITEATEKTYRYDWSCFPAWLCEADVAPVLGSLSRQLLVAHIAAQRRRTKKKGAGTLSSHSVHKYTRVIRPEPGRPLGLPSPPLGARHAGIGD